jgi:hypothetical protein
MSKIKLIRILLFAGALLLASNIYAQISVNTSGADASGNGGKVAYSIGQIFYTTNTDNAGVVSQGVQQTIQISNVGIKETSLNISLEVFPNPTTDDLNLKIKNFNGEKLSYQLYDMQGKLLKNGKILSKQTLIEMSNYPSASYTVNVVSSENQNIQSFKIIKN